ncbi:hypothetical protein FGG08_004595 [Glutinoglossum americanum]|uniref:Pre-mRNA-splicing factor 38B n=1 Tax=Glutinoglossum americanum TaxID=1670608 RepID=A0A9P8I1Z9_9PEZI|nr:hypothetical protein FGG08_004595 [Glutinoglossum americanum]
MPTEESLSDSHIAELLKKDAADRSLRYSAMGLQAFLPKRPTTNAPKPNTRFLRNIIRETDNHNAALRAKEVDESRVRLRALQCEPDPQGMRVKGDTHRRSRDTHCVDKADSDRESRYSKRKRLEYNESDYESGHRRHRHKRSHGSSRREGRGEREKSECARSKDHDSPLRDRQEDKGRKRRRSRSEEPPRRRHDGDRDRRRRHRSRSRTRASAKEREKDEEYYRSRRRRHSTVSSNYSPLPQRKEPRHNSTSAQRSPKRKRAPSLAPSSGSESDPLAAIIGPPPPPPEPKVISRGRGTFASSTMDTHFSSAYDPTTDVRPDSDSEDDWDQALETLRDRERWKQQGAERLRSAGFTEEEVKNWESGRTRKEEDVRWAKRGEGREWDRGKVVDEDGHVEVKPEWGRLKGT